MRASKYLLSTLKETPTDAELVSHRYMLRAGMIRREASGLYIWLPTGFRVLKKIEAIIREEMNKANAIEILMPMVQPADLWKETARWEKYGNELLRLKDRNERDFVLGPTHEEVITDLIRNEINSYKELPFTLYQIQTKFRDEIRPRFGVMRAREFLMKDAYSFHLTEASLDETYDLMYKTYHSIFSRLQLDFRAVQADTGSIGGNASHEFQVLAESGEDLVVFSTESDYAANLELARAGIEMVEKETPKSIEILETPNIKTISELAEKYSISPKKMVKTLIVKTNENSKYKLIALLLRGDHEINEAKLKQIPDISEPLIFATDEEILNETGFTAGFLGPKNLNLPIFADQSIQNLSNFVIGANQKDQHLMNVNWEIDLPLPEFIDLRNVCEGDLSPDGKGTLLFKRGIEVGHIFKLGLTYSKSMNATVQDENGKNKIITMGCYGIGISRIVAAAIEQNYDENGIIWPDTIAPFQLVIIPMNMHKSDLVAQTAEKLYKNFQDKNIDVLFDDRKERAGVMFADAELIGIPHILIIGERGLENQEIEYKSRKTGQKEMVKLNELMEFLAKKSPIFD